MTVSQALDWIGAHAPWLWPALSALLLMLLRARTPEAWVALGERHPRVQGAIRLLRAIGLDPAKAIAGLVQLVAGRAPVDPREAELVALRAEVARQRDVIAALRATQPEVP